MVALYRKAGDRTKQIRLAAMVVEMLDGLLDEQRRLLPRSFRAEH
jgi:hypothetical protein